MLKVLIVDDDFLVRLFLKGAIDWNNNGYEIIGEAIDGHEALEKIETLKPDIVILDISMPGMNGVELMKEINMREYSCKVIVLSCHDDFQYVKETLKLGAVEYILKNLLKADNLLNVLDGVKNRIEKERLQKGQYNEILLLANKGRAVLKQQFILQLMRGMLKDENKIKNKIMELNLRLQLNAYFVITLDIDDYKFVLEMFGKKDKELLNFSILNICQEILNDYNIGEVVNIFDRRFVMILSFSGTKSYLDINNEVNSIVAKVLNCISKYLNFTTSIGVSELGTKISDMHIFFNQADMALQSRFYSGKNRAYYYKDFKQFSTIPLKLDKEKEKEFVHFIKNGMKNDLYKLIDSYFIEFKRILVKPSHLYNFCMEIIRLINMVGNQYNIAPRDIYDVEYAPYEILESLDTMDDTRKFIKESIERLIEILCIASSNSNYNNAVKECLKHIHSNYMKDISLSVVAGYVNVSPAYLSFLFKQETGKNFTDYLKELRIQKAIELMETTNQKISEIAQNVGISNRKYFSKLFKEKVGLSPAEYKKQ